MRLAFLTISQSRKEVTILQMWNLKANISRLETNSNKNFIDTVEEVV